MLDDIEYVIQIDDFDETLPNALISVIQQRNKCIVSLMEEIEQLKKGKC